MLVVAIVPAYKEQDSIAGVIEALLDQERVPDRIVIVPNGCKSGGSDDQTAEIARTFTTDARADGRLVVLELPKLKHLKSEALNIAWNKYGRDAGMVICLDADTILPPNAVADWEQEMECDERLGGSSSKFTMQQPGFWPRLQRAEFAAWTDQALRRGYTTVLAGTGCAISGEALRRVVDETGRYGPWSYDSQVEDFELTYQIRARGYRCQVSPTVRAYTDSMPSLRPLWGQRMKWQVGTVEDLLTLGLNKLTLIDWWQQAVGLAMAGVRLLWVALIVAQIALGLFAFSAVWWLVVPVFFAVGQGLMSLRIPHRDHWDVLYGFAIVPAEIFAWVRSAWFVWAWIVVFWSRVTGIRKDRWSAQYAAEGV